MADFFEILTYPFMQRAMAASAVIAAICSFIGVLVVLRGLSFVGVGISHSAFAGVAIGALCGVAPLLGAAIFCSLVACGIGYVTRLGRFREDTAIGIFFAASMAVGLLLLDLLHDPTLTLSSILFGSVISLSYGDFVLALVIGLVLGIMMSVFYKDFQVLAFDEELAYLNGAPVTLLFYGLLIAVALCVVVSMKVVGAILVSALLVTPAATALLLARDYDRVVLYSVIIGVGTTEVGLLLSYVINIAPSASITLLSTILFLGAWLYRKNVRFSNG